MQSQFTFTDFQAMSSKMFEMGDQQYVEFIKSISRFSTIEEQLSAYALIELNLLINKASNPKSSAKIQERNILFTNDKNNFLKKSGKDIEEHYLIIYHQFIKQHYITQAIATDKFTKASDEKKIKEVKNLLNIIFETESLQFMGVLLKAASKKEKYTPEKISNIHTVLVYLVFDLACKPLADLTIKPINFDTVFNHILFLNQKTNLFKYGSFLSTLFVFYDKYKVDPNSNEIKAIAILLHHTLKTAAIYQFSKHALTKINDALKLSSSFQQDSNEIDAFLAKPFKNTEFINDIEQNIGNIEKWMLANIPTDPVEPEFSIELITTIFYLKMAKDLTLNASLLKMDFLNNKKNINILLQNIINLPQLEPNSKIYTIEHTRLLVLSILGVDGLAIELTPHLIKQIGNLKIDVSDGKEASYYKNILKNATKEIHESKRLEAKFEEYNTLIAEAQSENMLNVDMIQAAKDELNSLTEKNGIIQLLNGLAMKISHAKKQLDKAITLQSQVKNSLEAFKNNLKNISQTDQIKFTANDLNYIDMTSQKLTAVNASDAIVSLEEASKKIQTLSQKLKEFIIAKRELVNNNKKMIKELKSTDKWESSNADLSELSFDTIENENEKLNNLINSSKEESSLQPEEKQAIETTTLEQEPKEEEEQKIAKIKAHDQKYIPSRTKTKKNKKKLKTQRVTDEEPEYEENVNESLVTEVSQEQKSETVTTLEKDESIIQEKNISSTVADVQPNLEEIEMKPKLENPIDENKPNLRYTKKLERKKKKEALQNQLPTSQILLSVPQSVLSQEENKSPIKLVQPEIKEETLSQEQEDEIEIKYDDKESLMPVGRITMTPELKKMFEVPLKLNNNPRECFLMGSSVHKILYQDPVFSEKFKRYYLKEFETDWDFLVKFSPDAADPTFFHKSPVGNLYQIQRDKQKDYDNDIDIVRIDSNRSNAECLRNASTDLRCNKVVIDGEGVIYDYSLKNLQGKKLGMSDVLNLRLSIAVPPEKRHSFFSDDPKRLLRVLKYMMRGYQVDDRLSITLMNINFGQFIWNENNIGEKQFRKQLIKFIQSFQDSTHESLLLLNILSSYHLLDKFLEYKILTPKQISALTEATYPKSESSSSLSLNAEAKEFKPRSIQGQPMRGSSLFNRSMPTAEKESPIKESSKISQVPTQSMWQQQQPTVEPSPPSKDKKGTPKESTKTISAIKEKK